MWTLKYGSKSRLLCQFLLKKTLIMVHNSIGGRSRITFWEKILTWVKGIRIRLGWRPHFWSATAFRARKADSSASIIRFRCLGRWSVLFGNENKVYITYHCRRRLQLQVLNAVTLRIILQQFSIENLRVTEVFNFIVALLMLIFFTLKCTFKWDLGCVEMKQIECVHETMFPLWTNSTLKRQYRLTVFQHSDLWMN